jgi:hypothetical protein
MFSSFIRYRLFHSIAGIYHEARARHEEKIDEYLPSRLARKVTEWLYCTFSVLNRGQNNFPSVFFPPFVVLIPDLLNITL